MVKTAAPLHKPMKALPPHTGFKQAAVLDLTGGPDGHQFFSGARTVNAPPLGQVRELNSAALATAQLNAAKLGGRNQFPQLGPLSRSCQAAEPALRRMPRAWVGGSSAHFPRNSTRVGLLRTRVECRPVSRKSQTPLPRHAAARPRRALRRLTAARAASMPGTTLGSNRQVALEVLNLWYWLVATLFVQRVPLFQHVVARSCHIVHVVRSRLLCT